MLHLLVEFAGCNPLGGQAASVLPRFGGDFQQGALQSFDVDRFGKVPRETGGVRLPDVGVVSGAADGKARDRGARTQRAEQVVAGAIRKRQVADEAVEVLGRKGDPRLRAGAGGDDRVAAPAEELGHDDGGGRVVIDHEQGQPRGVGGWSGFGHEARKRVNRNFGKAKPASSGVAG